MSKLYIITGPAGVGKSTVSENLAERLEKSALIEGDDLYHMVKSGYVNPWQEANHMAVFWENATHLIENFLSAGFDVVFNYILSPTEVSALKESLSTHELHLAVLMTDESTLISRDQLREPDCRMGERSLVLLREFAKRGYEPRFVIDSSKLSIDETVALVMQGDNTV